MKKFTLLLAIAAVSLRSIAQTGIDIPSMHKCDTLIKTFMATYGMPGATVAITKDGRLIYNRAFGFADQAGTEPMQPYALQRIASNSKAITAIAIMKLIENGVVRLNDTVFGATHILNRPYYLGAITDARIYNITVKELLEHTAGWDRSVSCDGQNGCDPISFPLHVTGVMGEGNPVGDSTLIKFLLTKGLNTAPGVAYAYSNIGYLILGKVIEAKTGMKYADYVSSIIMQPLGLSDMHLGKNLLADKQEREAEYNNSYTTLSCYGTGATVPWQYGGWNLEAMNAHGGWISTSEDYVRMILAVDGFNTVPDILNASTIATMTTPSSANANYAKGWSVNSYNNWWHTGSLDGTTTFMARTANGYTWAFHFNARSSASNFSSDLDALPWNCIAAVTTFPSHDLFAPKTQASALTAVKTGPTSAHLSWAAGNGDMRVVLATENNSWKSFPAEGVTYAADNTFGNAATALGNSTYVVYNGAGNSADITGLDASKTYQFTVLDGYNNAVTGNKAVYKYGGRSNATLNMAATIVSTVAGAGKGLTIVYPNPSKDVVTLETTDRELRGTAATISDVQGRAVMQIQVLGGSQKVDLRQLSPGVYYLHFKNGATHKLIKN